ncbi:MAG: tetraacyldisaccharide 4'-kinase [Syntrophobacteraceae bacterium]
MSEGTGASPLDAGVRGAVHRRIVRLWHAADGVSSLPAPARGALQLFSKVYEAGLRRNQQRQIESRLRLPATVVSIGNLVAGGTGKTPLVLWIAEHLQRLGRSPAILSRGYGRSTKETSEVPATGDLSRQASLFGDEPVLMARKASPVPVWVGRDRRRSGRASILAGGADILLLDDGFQHLALVRDLDLVLLDARNPFGNGSLLPLGPLREPVAHLERADAIILTRADDSGTAEKNRAMLERMFPGKPLFCCRHRLSGFRAGLGGALIPASSLRGRRALAFAGIASPDSFFESLRETGVNLIASISFPDHHPYAPGDMLRIAAASADLQSELLITTQKDFVRLPDVLQQAVLTAELRIDFGRHHEAFCSFLDAKCSLHGGPPF